MIVYHAPTYLEVHNQVTNYKVGLSYAETKLVLIMHKEFYQSKKQTLQLQNKKQKRTRDM